VDLSIGAAALVPRLGAFPNGGATEFLCAPFDTYSPSRLLEHFCARKTVAYFPIEDEDESRDAKIEAILRDEFEFNHERHRLEPPRAWLDNPSVDAEWQILLHKFYFAVGLGRRFHESTDRRYLDKWVELTDSWIAVTPPGFIAADVTGRRIQNWIYAHYYFVTLRAVPQIPPTFYRRFLASLSEQVEWLCANLAPARNHRTLELYAIFLTAVVFPEMRGAARWLEFSLAEIARNAETDLLPDGVQIELSTDYHHIVLRNFLCLRRLAELNKIAIPSAMDRALVKALEFSLHAHRPDGIVPAFSDGDARDYRVLLQWGYELYHRADFLYVASGGRCGTPPGSRCARFDNSGYYVLRSGWGEQEPYRDERFLMFDCGPLGAGNHGHFDLLSFEAYAYGRPLVVDPGRYTYSEAGEVNWRAVFRGSEAHNTVLVDGRNQTRYSPGKRKLKVSGPAPRHALRALSNAPSFDLLHGVAESHEYPVVHERLIAFIAHEYWIVSDLLHARDQHRYDLLFHLAPEAHGHVVQHERDGTRLVEAPHLSLVQCADAQMKTSIEDGFVSQRYGEKVRAPLVRTAQSGRCLAFHSVIYPYRHKAPILTLRTLPVTTDAETRADHRTQALALTVGGDGTATTDIWLFSTAALPRKWTVAGYSFDGNYLWLRENAAGRLLACHCGGGVLSDETGRRVAMSGKDLS
jgi:Heparinase II/III-like protein/Heparinase II/III N-terminus